MSDDRVRTFVKLRGRRAIPFQEYFVRGRARGVVEKIELRGIANARPTPAVLDAIRKSAAVILAPSNPFVSLGPILQLTGVREALRRVKSRVAAISPIVGGKTIKGPADKMLRGLGMEVRRWESRGLSRHRRTVRSRQSRSALRRTDRAARHARDRDRHNHDHARARRRARQSGSARA